VKDTRRRGRARGPRQDILLTDGAEKTASVPTAAASKEAGSSRDSITTTSHTCNAAEEIRSSVSLGGSYVWRRQHPHSGENPTRHEHWRHEQRVSHL